MEFSGEEAFLNEIDLINKYDRIIKSWLGTPYFHMACEKGAGADCTKFIGACMVEAGIFSQLKPREYYPRDWMVHGNTEILFNSFNEHISLYTKKPYRVELFTFEKENRFDESNLPKIDDLFFGDVLCFSNQASRLTNHTAIYLSKGEMVHAINKKGVCITQLNKVWYSQMTGVYRVYIDIPEPEPVVEEGEPE